MTEATAIGRHAAGCPADKALQTADLYCDVQEPVTPWRSRMRGLLLVGLGTLAAGFFAERYGAPLTLAALLVGLMLNSVSSDARLHPGLDFAARTPLRWGIVLAGLQVTYGKVADLGPVSLVAIVVTAAIVILSGLVAAHLAGQRPAFGLLAGGAVAICGASAALAIAATLGERRLGRHELTAVLIGIAVLSPAAMIGYPMIAHNLFLTDVQAGFMLGDSIHDVAQAIGAGYSFSQDAGQVATIVKLVRVALLTPLLLTIALLLSIDRRTAGPAIPWFVIGFFAFAGINSLGVVPPAAAALAGQCSTALLALAVTAVAMAAPVRRLGEMGWRPVFTMVVPTLTALAAALFAASFLVG